ncbi:TonB-dependent siderophore receptor [Dickeya dianthicola]|uniref:TonB-dependent siderophore receptor n=1 Tax=Dickeya dianthicola TaxID=204039 RepID=A0AAW4LHI5_9GAMM|nr:TonB-dependent siderophore receptor [Dickeya dianthicola]MBT1428916.1 TonB-dependent siderophore receptor [Dickeya dianthicola]MBT1460417.1 TonB-dependent siderophore receptor [Dickeya dianthicola]MBT1489614.1 TonB-dependent siderophore receptor [Dickeya dianthicola]MCI4001833.1 TonB-dependent siderophore receptor [Dickeya dianthicola]MCI4238540.1 TonB-dependent siderophore receptor [Dickeya dianthicola]
MHSTRNKQLKKLKSWQRNSKTMPAVLASTLLMAAHAQAADTTNSDTMIVSANAGESVTAPLKGIVAKESASGTKTSTPLIKTPQSVTVVTRDQMDAQAVSSVSDALNYSSGVVTNYRGSSNRNDEVIARGFRYAPKFLDGLSYGLSGQGAALGKIDPWLLERVELVHGPASVLYGQVNPGGLISMTSKRPTAETIRKVQFSAGNQHLGEAAFDFGGALNDDKTLLYRLNGIASTRDEFVNDYKEKRVAIAPAITWLPNSDTSFTLLATYQNDPKAGYRNFLPKIGTVTEASAGYIPNDLNVSDPNYNRSKREQVGIGYIFDHSFSDNVSFQQNFRYSQLRERYKYLVYTWSNPEISDTSLSRRQVREELDADELGLDNQIKVKLATGEVQHTLLSGLDYKWQDRDYNYWRNGGDQYNFDWANPSYGGSYLVSDSQLALNQSYKKKLDQVGVYLQDQMEWNQWNLLLSGRHDWSEIRTQDHTTSTTTQQNDSKFTGRTGLLYAFDNGISPYVSYSTSFEPNLDSGAPGTPAFKPTTGEQQEVGVKFQPKGSNTLLTVSLFDITQKNITSYNSVTQYNEQIGKVKSKGVETEVHSQLTPEISLMAAYTYTDAVTKESYTASQVNKAPSSIPRHSASAWGSYSFQHGVLSGVTFGTGVRYIGSTYGDNAEGFKVPAYTLYDAMARYELGSLASQLKGAAVQLNVNNLTDKRYVASCGGDTACFYGSGRTVVATVSYSW